MILIEHIALYLMIGVGLNLMYEFIIRRLEYLNKKVPDFNDFDKLTSILIWPIGFIIFLIAFIKALLKR